MRPDRPPILGNQTELSAGSYTGGVRGPTQGNLDELVPPSDPRAPTAPPTPSALSAPSYPTSTKPSDAAVTRDPPTGMTTSKVPWALIAILALGAGVVWYTSR